MDMGELWFEENPSVDLEFKVLQAARKFQRKYGQAPNLCLVHPSLLGGGQRSLGTLKLEGQKSILPNYLWIGVEGRVETRPTGN